MGSMKRVKDVNARRSLLMRKWYTRERCCRKRNPCSLVTWKTPAMLMLRRYRHSEGDRLRWEYTPSHLKYANTLPPMPRSHFLSLTFRRICRNAPWSVYSPAFSE